MRRTRIRPQNPCVLSICDERAFVPKTLAFLVYAPPRQCAAARAAPLILRPKTRYAPPRQCAAARAAPLILRPKTRAF